MKMRCPPNRWILGLAITLSFGITAFLTACSFNAPAQCPEVDCPQCPPAECPEVVCPEPVAGAFPHQQSLWASSAHNVAESAALQTRNAGNSTDNPASCARCHSTPGYLDFLGADGTQARAVDSALKTSPAITCLACHNELATAAISATFPSGQVVSGAGDEARCMHCHQGRTSSTTVDDAIAEAGLSDDDTISPELDFVDIHHLAAAATRMGTWARGAYQYEGKCYDARFAHVERYDACTDCHDPHSLKPQMAACAECHRAVDDVDDLDFLRGRLSVLDYDGDERVGEGIVFEIAGLQENLYQAIQAYASRAGTPIIYDPYAAPFFFLDGNANRDVDEGEAVQANRYNAWSGRLLKAAYNYHFSVKDPGAHVHNAKYIIQLLFDSIEDLDADLVKRLSRDDAAHFVGSGEAWRHWDEDGEVPGTCARCHSATGLPTYLLEGANTAAPPAHGMLCATCHADHKRFRRHVARIVDLPSGAQLSIDSDNNLCMSCHQGRESSAGVDKLLEGLDPDIVAEGLSFPDVHYGPAGATLFGSEARGAYQYAGGRYAGRDPHVLDFDTCIDCHGAHRLTVDEELCATCHGRRAGADTTKPRHVASGIRSCSGCHGTVEVENIRGHKDYTTPVDYDGDGDVKEGFAYEVTTIHDALYAAIQAYADSVVEASIVYEAQTPPYFFADGNGNGEPDADETTPESSYGTWTPRMLKAAYNYHYVSKDPGAFAHNGKYIVQVLYDSLRDIGGDTRDMIRP